MRPNYCRFREQHFRMRSPESASKVSGCRRADSSYTYYGKHRLSVPETMGQQSWQEFAQKRVGRTNLTTVPLVSLMVARLPAGRGSDTAFPAAVYPRPRT